MAILSVDHPDIEEFIDMKNDLSVMTNFNVSVALTEKFMEEVERGEDHALLNPRTGQVLRAVPARYLFDKIVHNAWRTGEPGIVFIDRTNNSRSNPTPQLGEIESTNPCGEQPLLPYESCNLGSINLGKFVKESVIDWKKLKEVIHNSVHFLDNVIEANNYPLQQIDDMTRANRKIGLGVMGWADMLILLGIPYSSPEAVKLGKKIMKYINDEGHLASQELAKKRGSFPNFKGSIFDKKGAPPMRNATVSTIAPTGTISIIANASSGVEPLFAVSYIRTVMDKNVMIEVNPMFEQIAKERGFYSEEVMKKIAEHGTVADIPEVPADVRNVFVTAHDINPEDHIHMQSAFQLFTDNAVSKTVNFPNTATIDDVEKVYMMAYQTGCKGVTIYRDGSRDEQVLSTGKKEEIAAEVVLVEDDKNAVKRDRPKALRGWTYQMQ